MNASIIHIPDYPYPHPPLKMPDSDLACLLVGFLAGFGLAFALNCWQNDEETEGAEHSITHHACNT